MKPALSVNEKLVAAGTFEYIEAKIRREAERTTLVRTAEGLSTDVRTLAAQIGLAKANQKYGLRKLITSHPSATESTRSINTYGQTPCRA